jgi:malonyl-CoA/methylmalonyl-CoA synthetase
VQLIDLFATSLVGQRDDIAIEFDARDGSVGMLTFGELDARSNRLARVLAARGFRKGDRLGIHLPNCVEFIDFTLACVKLGVILVPINVLYREREIGHLVIDSEPRGVVSARSSPDLFPADVPRLDVDEIAGAARNESADPFRVDVDGDTPAAIVYTSGTTGRSKGAVLTHNNFLVNTANLIACWRITRADRYLAVLPLFHVHGLANGMMSWLASGCRMRLVDRFATTRAAELFTTFEPTLFFGVPTIYVRLLELPPTLASEIGRRLRLFVSGSAPLPVSLFDTFRGRFGHAILERYGMSETLMNASNPYDGERRPGSVGLPLPGISIRIVDGTATDVATGAVGEILVRGPNVFAGYWRQPDATAAAFADGWFRTGDLGARSADGYITLRGRRTDVIISGGFNIYPREVEDVLTEASGVREAVVIGVPDARRGELPVAYIVAEGEIDASALEARCRRALASFKVPRAFVRVDTLPRTALGKVQKHLLPAWSVERK